MITTYRYLRHGQPLPKGWRLAHDLNDTRHGHFAILIKQDSMSNHPRRNIIKNWPKYLKEFRAKYHLTQNELADRLQISGQLVRAWEQAVNRPPAYLKKALQVLEADICGKK